MTQKYLWTDSLDKSVGLVRLLPEEAQALWPGPRHSTGSTNFTGLDLRRRTCHDISGSNMIRLLETTQGLAVLH